ELHRDRIRTASIQVRSPGTASTDADCQTLRALMAVKKTLWLLPFLVAAPLLAVTPFFWETRTNDDFRKGTFSNLSLTNEDRLVLAPRFESVFNTDQPFVWSAAADSKGNVYLGTGHDGKVYRVDPSGKGSLLADF